MAQRYVVVGKCPVLGRKRGEHVYLEDAHAARLMRMGHVELAPAEEEPSAAASLPPPSRRETKKTTTRPRPSAGPSHVQTPEPAQGPPEVKEQADAS